MSETASWLSEFFNSDNSICLVSVLDGKYDHLSQSLFFPLVESAYAGRWPFVLPLKTKSQGELFFYAGAQNSRKLSELRSVMLAFLGSADVSPDFSVIKTPQNNAEQALLKHVPHGVIKVALLEQADANAKIRVYQALAKMLELYEERPEMRVDFVRPIGRILRDFFSSCSIRDGEAALSFYDELKSSGNVSRRNLLSLELQALAAGEKWQDLLGHSQLSYLLQGRVPIRVAMLLLRALGYSGLYDLYDSQSLSRESIESARAICGPLSPLFRSPPVLERNSSFEDDWKVWVIGAELTGTPDYTREIPHFIDRDWLTKLRELTGNSHKQEINQAPTHTPKLGDINSATDLLQQSLTATPSELERIVAEIESLPEETLERLEQFPRLSELWSSLKAERVASDGSWSSWFNQISNPKADIDALEQECIHSCHYWTSESFDPNHIQKVLETNNVERVGMTLRNILPILLSWIGEREISCRASFWGVWVEFLALDDVVTSQDIAISEQILSNFIDQPYTKEEYKQLIEALELLWEKGGAVSSYSSMLDVIEILLESSCPDRVILEQLWQSTQIFALKKWSRIEVGQQQLTKSIALEVLGEGNAASYPDDSSSGESTADNDSGYDLSGKLLAIYTLTEGAGRRAKAVLEKLFYGLTVITNSDHVATSELTNLAKKADYFIFSANSSKHQAFYPVKKIRNDLIYPLGKGSSSIINAFVSQVLT